MTTQVLTQPRAGSAAGALAERRVNVMLLASHLWIGGAETVIRHLAETIDRDYFGVTVCHLKERGSVGDEIARAGIDVVGVDDHGPDATTRKVDYFSFRKLLRIIRARRIDVVHTHTTHGLVDATLCKLLSPGLKVVHTFHFGNYPHVRPRVKFMERWFSRLADRLFAVGNTQRGQIQAVYGFRDRDIATLWNGVMLKSAAGDAGFRARMGATDRVLIGTIATLIPQKGLFDLLAVARQIKDAGVPATFVIAGEGKLRGELEQRRRQLDLEDTVMLPGWVADAAATALPVFDVFFQPSHWEAMSMVILEAMGASKAIVATRVGENAYVLEHDVDGLLADARDIDGMTAALLRVITNPALRQRLGTAARAKVERQLTVAHMTRAYEAVYRDALHGGAAR